ncbi:MAG: fumarylacetoacetate hydrolase family protein [Gammaproteobacteria bacterium]|nr:fumarylacetoacetate hydrolase family protein [Gammaproteobacteria bacterium]
MSHYFHQFNDGSAFPFPLGKIVCVGRNYAEHAKELNNPVPTTPILFMKPATSATPLAQPVRRPQGLGSVHYEAELAILIGATLHQATPEAAEAAIAGYGLALDLTLRDVQDQLKKQGHPWEIAKAFDGACPLSDFVPGARLKDREYLQFSLSIDGQCCQHGDTRDMLTPVIDLLCYMSRYFTLQPGDVVLTGTPKGVGTLNKGQQLHLRLEDVLVVTTHVAD